MAGTLRDSYRLIKSQLKTDAQQTVRETARRVLARSKEMVPQPSLSRGYALGALKESGYIRTTDENGYNRGIARALSTPDTRILHRRQILPPSGLVEPVGHHVALIAYPLEYAMYIHEGFFHVRAQRHIIGVNFLLSAMQSEQDYFYTTLKGDIRLLEHFHEPAVLPRSAWTPQQREAYAARQADAPEQAALARERAEVYVTSRLHWDAADVATSRVRGETLLEAHHRSKGAVEEYHATDNHFSL